MLHHRTYGLLLCPVWAVLLPVLAVNGAAAAATATVVRLVCHCGLTVTKLHILSLFFFLLLYLSPFVWYLATSLAYWVRGASCLLHFVLGSFRWWRLWQQVAGPPNASTFAFLPRLVTFVPLLCRIGGVSSAFRQTISRGRKVIYSLGCKGVGRLDTFSPSHPRGSLCCCPNTVLTWTRLSFALKSSSLMVGTVERFDFIRSNRETFSWRLFRWFVESPYMYSGLYACTHVSARSTCT